MPQYWSTGISFIDAQLPTATFILKELDKSLAYGASARYSNGCENTNSKTSWRKTIVFSL